MGCDFQRCPCRGQALVWLFSSLSGTEARWPGACCRVSGKTCPVAWEDVPIFNSPRHGVNERAWC